MERMINLVEAVKQEEEDAKDEDEDECTEGKSEEEEEEKEEEKEATAPQKMESVSINKILDERNLSPACLYSERHAELTLQVDILCHTLTRMVVVNECQLGMSHASSICNNVT